ncbi:Rab-GTPase-TBC domain [Pseudocohnilembus persalinus]|uniref:Rab-GTPase-TBC domain n=1 Tax=Pseudocohnilembus persalinus TaxID=266149 RepID=A0A0V0R325_PSEPJ|nr:Rab-GTPase-TBC domain [Pseudocohnilembus persalinus]|eukprot:KRX08914.1 Rab-GTPase-TBC domain [Pseudocohnilembus persalinus]
MKFITKKTLNYNQKMANNLRFQTVNQEFSTILNQQTVNYQDLQKKSWNGIPQVFRSLVWRIILHYMPTNKLIADEVLDKKRSEYWQQVEQYYLDIEELDDKEKYMRKIVLKDVPRTQPDYEIFKHPRVQEMLQRILYVWNVRHPACGYVQGMNEIVTVFIVVFLQEYVQLNQETFEIPDNIHNVKREEWDTVEADSYWCLSRILDKIQDNYTHGQPGIKKCLDKMEQVVTKLDPELIAVFKNQHVQFVQFAFRWVLCLLIREIPLPQALRLFDTYISDEQGFQNLHIYVCAATLLQYSKTLQKQNFNEIIMFLQNIPTKDLKQQDIELLIQQGYVYQQMYDQSQGHIKKTVNLEWL